ncbi:hypothetical protein LTR56_010562 [Elasticomyces elasticus]|nr:hypothetical protein LTR22_024522 [Elasticomyces elasticus]KAK3642738.1 hypothetical protein LTR56_010562 [Elasticomyces elasticus]KAK4932418.1 hypothetical protein LTR49_001287 [Elasticomyces elasticus]KAK5760119.1 hypothetical protein LTS12_009674 [Elasticomyces elasticus]
MSRHSTPTSGLGRLTLRDREANMPVTTRAKSGQVKKADVSRPVSSTSSKRPSGMQSGRQRAPQTGSSRAVASSSRAPSSRQQASRQTAEVPSGDDSSGDDSDSSDADVEEAGETAEQAATAQGNRRRAIIYLALAPSNDDGLSPSAFAASMDQAGLMPNTQMAHRVVRALFQLVRSDEDLAILQACIPVPGPIWSQQLALNMYRRFQAIAQGLEQNALGGVGQDVVRTIDALRSMFHNIDDIRSRYFGGLDVGTRDRLMTTLITIMNYIVSNNGDLYTNVNRPAYAGEGSRNERRLFSCFMSPESGPQQFITVLRKCSEHLTHERVRIRAIRTLFQEYAANGIEGGVPRADLELMANHLGAILQLIP